MRKCYSFFCVLDFYFLEFNEISCLLRSIYKKSDENLHHFYDIIK
jgi:hypothetical protein